MYLQHLLVIIISNEMEIELWLRVCGDRVDGVDEVCGVGHW